MGFNLRVVGTALATATVLAVAAGPASAATNGPSLAKAELDVHAANVALSQLSHFGSTNSKSALKALARTRHEAAAAAHQARWLHSHRNVKAAATAFEGVALQYDRQVKTYTAMVANSTGTVQASVAQALVPALAGRTQALGFLGQLIGMLPVSGAGTATSTITGVLGNSPSEITSLTGILGNLPTQIQQIIAQAITAAGGVLDAGVTELEGIIPSLPASVQPIVQQLLTALTNAFGQLKSVLTGTGTTSSIGGLFGGLIGTELGQVTSILQTLLGNLPNLFGNLPGLGGTLPGLGGVPGLGGTLPGTGTGTGTGTGVGGILGSLPFGIGSILSGLFGNLGLGNMGLGMFGL